jgi:hypothetical protein
MDAFFDITGIFLATFSLALVMPIFWIVLFLVYMQYRRQILTEEKLFGRSINPLGRQVLLSVLLGALGGLLASMVLVFLGLSLEQIGLYFIWPVALFLLLINPRYLCFSYAGGLVALMVLFVRYLLLPFFPALATTVVIDSLLKIHIPALLVLIALLHLIEALLIYIGGHWGSSPIYLKRDNGKVIGAFTLQRFWPIPLVALMVAVVAQSEIVGVNMPDWWPILQSTILPGEGESLQYMVIPVAAGLGYADVAFSSPPRLRSAFSAKILALYSLVLLAVAIGSEYYAWLILPGVIFAPLGHELLIIYGKYREEKRSLRFAEPQEGVQLMMVLPGTAAAEAGLQEEDIIGKINGQTVLNNRDLIDKIEASYFMVLFDIIRQGENMSIIFKKRSSSPPVSDDFFSKRPRIPSAHNIIHRGVELGLITVPDQDSPVYLEIKKPDPIGRLKRLQKKLLKRKRH